MYEHLIKKNQLDPKKCVFIDNEKEHIATAKEMGITTIASSCTKKVKSQLRQLGIKTG